jgi:ABC-2 type transport system permease protein
VSAAPGVAEIFDLGYEPYDGERTSPWARRRAIWRDGVRIALGLGRGASGKIAPWGLMAFAFVPAVVLVVIAAFVGSVATDTSDFELPSYGEYYQFAIVPLGLFAAVIGPLLLCPDRRDGVLSLYAARPITPTDYIASRWVAFFTVTATIAWLPEATLFAWNALDAQSPGTWLRENWDILPRFLLAGALIAASLTALALFAASFTTRRMYATIGAVATLFIGSAIGGIAEDNFSGTASDVVSLAALPHVIVDSAQWILGDQPLGRPVSPAVSALWLAVLAAGLSVLLLVRSRRLMRG